jgi:hypothetical protein
VVLHDRTGECVLWKGRGEVDWGHRGLPTCLWIGLTASGAALCPAPTPDPHTNTVPQSPHPSFGPHRSPPPSPPPNAPNTVGAPTFYCPGPAAGCIGALRYFSSHHVEVGGRCGRAGIPSVEEMLSRYTWAMAAGTHAPPQNTHTHTHTHTHCTRPHTGPTAPGERTGARSDPRGFRRCASSSGA